MEFINKIEAMVAGWAKSVPHLPAAGQKWLGQNVWWITLVGTILSAIGLLIALGALFTLIALLGAVSSSIYGAYATAGVSGFTIIGSVIGLVLSAATLVLMAFAIKPLKDMKKQGWVLLFLSWLVYAVSVVINSVLSLNVVGFILGIIFGAVALAVSGYFLFEIHAQFAHVRTIKAKTAKKA